jgi:hypothetical protein
VGKKRERERDRESNKFSRPSKTRREKHQTHILFQSVEWRRRETQNRVSIQFSKPPETKSKTRDYKFESRLNCSVPSNLGFIGD